MTPSFNQGRFLGATIESIISQRYPKLEYIVVDGGSRDESLNVLKTYSTRITRWVSEADKGHADALMKGFRWTSGDIMGWINSDDMLAPGSLSIVGELFESFPEMKWLMGLPTVWDNSGRPVQTVVRRRNRLDHLRGRFGIQQESCFWRRELWERAGAKLDASYGLMIDSELWSRFFEHADLWHLDAVLGGYRWHGENRAVQEHDRASEETRRAFARLHQTASPSECELARRLEVFDRQRAAPGKMSRITLRLEARRLRKATHGHSYRVIHWHRGEWLVRNEPYEI